MFTRSFGEEEQHEEVDFASDIRLRHSARLGAVGVEAGMKKYSLVQMYEKLKKELTPERLREFLEVEKVGYEEKPYIEKLLKQVQRKMGVVDRIHVQPEIPMSLMGKETYVGIGVVDGPQLLFAPGVSSHLNEEMMLGVIAHELGHYINGDPQRKLEQFRDDMSEEELEKLNKSLYTQQREQEYAADEMAARFGYGRGLRMAFSHILRSSFMQNLMDDGSGSHPRITDRIARLRQYDDLKEAA
jgi:predicted SprT family Zn-dependent metalloprotease